MNLFGKNDLFLKHNILSDGLHRRYVIKIHERKYDLDFTTPIELHILVPYNWENKDPFMISNPIEKVFKKRSWSQLIKELFLYLQEKNPKQKHEILKFKTDWSNAIIFSSTKCIDNMVEVSEDMYLNINYTATHSSWFIGDLLHYYGINVGVLIIHRPPISEPNDVIDGVRKSRIEDFKRFLVGVYHKDEESADKIIHNIDHINYILTKLNTSYNDFFLFDDNQALSNYKSKIIKNCDKYADWSDKQKKAVHRYLDYLTAYYFIINKEAKKFHKKDLEFRFPII